jgi:hypothetical protein
MLQHLPPLEETRMTLGMIATEMMLTRMITMKKKEMTTAATARTTALTTMTTRLATRVMVLVRREQLATFTTRWTSLATFPFCSRTFYGSWATP